MRRWTVVVLRAVGTLAVVVGFLGGLYALPVVWGWVLMVSVCLSILVWVFWLVSKE